MLFFRSATILLMPLINQSVLMSGADFFSVEYALNPYMQGHRQANVERAMAEHKDIQNALEKSGIKVHKVKPPKDCQDGVYTANWGLCRDDKVVLSQLPNKREAEEPYAKKVLKDLGLKIIELPANLRFSGQGDALPCGNDLFTGSVYRTDKVVHSILAEKLGYHVISLQTIPKRSAHGYGRRLINPTTGWPDSFYYDIDLALSVLRAPEGNKKGLIAWCPTAFTRASRNRLRNYDGVEKIEVSRQEATKGFACNLVSTGETVIMSAHAPIYKAKLERHGFRVITISAPELAKGGGFIRCTTLSLG